MFTDAFSIMMADKQNGKIILLRKKYVFTIGSQLCKALHLQKEISLKRKVLKKKISRNKKSQLRCRMFPHDE
jgi:hypothetical protein